MAKRRTDGMGKFSQDEPPQEVLARKKPNFMRLSDVQEEEVHWVWYPYIPAGKLSLIEGDPGQGKSWITCAIAADLSSGRALPGMRDALPPQKILMLSAEDGLGDTVKPRIRMLNGNLDNIFVSDDYFILDPKGLRDMEDMMVRSAATIVFMDPIVAYMGGKIDMHRANEVRGLMTQLSESAKRTGSAIVAVRHLRKGGNDNKVGKAIYAGIGSIDFTAAVRSVMQVQETKGGTKFMYHAKHNLTPKGESLAYKLVKDHFEWEGVLPMQEAEHARKVSTKSRAIADAQQFMFDVLKDGPVSAVDMEQKAADNGIVFATLQRAKAGIAYSKKTPQGWVWHLEARRGMGDMGPARGEDGPVFTEKEREEIDRALAAYRATQGEVP